MSQADEDAIREIENQFNVAGNRHDPDAIAASLADDAQFITVNGATGKELRLRARSVDPGPPAAWDRPGVRVQAPGSFGVTSVAT